jgi:geranylgeranyl reductase family protein
MKRNANVADVIVVGAGPAGSSAAEVLAESGIGTIILERKQTVGIPNHCGEGIGKQVLKLLGYGGSEEWIVKHMTGAKYIFPNGKFFVLNDPGFCINRPLFDQERAERAQKRGARLLLQQKVIAIRREKGRWRVVTKKGKSYYGRYLIGADGAPSTVRRLFGLKDEYLGAIQYKFNTVRRFEEPYFAIYYREEHSPGYAWIFARGIETSIGIVSRGDLVNKLGIFLRAMNIDPEEKKSIQYGFIPYQSWTMCVSLSNVLFAGDAGGFNFPLSMGGVHGALLSGRIAGETLRNAIINGNPDGLRLYEGKMGFHPSRSRIAHFISAQFLSMKNESYSALSAVKHEQTLFTIPFLKSIMLLMKSHSFLAGKGLLIGLMAQQIVRRYRKYIF